MTNITIRLEAKTTPKRAAKEQEKITGLLNLFLGELGAEDVEVHEQTDTYQSAVPVGFSSEAEMIAAGKTRADVVPTALQTETRVVSTATVTV